VPGPEDELSVDATRLGQEFGLGARRLELSARRRARRVTIGILVIVLTVLVAVCFSPLMFIVASGVTRLVSTAATLALIATGVVMIRRAPPPQVDRAIWYSGGLIQQLGSEPEPRVIRWDELASVAWRTKYESEGEDLYVASTTVRDRAGTSITLDRLYSQETPPDLARKAIQVLTPRLVPGLMRDFDAGRRISFGGLSVDREGITNACGVQATAPLLTRWPDVQRIDIEGPGAAIRVVTGRFSSQRMDLDDCDNGPLAYHVVEHAAARHGIEVRHRDQQALPGRLPAPQLEGGDLRPGAPDA
jgi:hypothetical protein